MPHYAKESGGTQRDLPTLGLHKAVCVDAYDLGFQETVYGPKERTMLIWELDEEHPHFGGPFRINRKYTTSIHPESNLGKDLVSWRGVGFTQEERKEGFDLERLIGVGCHINVVHKQSEKNEIIYANVAAIMPLKRDEWPKPSGAYTRKTDQDAVKEHDRKQGARPDDRSDDRREDEARKRYGPQQPTPPVEAYANEQASYVEDHDQLPF